MHSCLSAAKPVVQSDLTVGMIMAVAATEAGLHTVKVNLKLLTEQAVVEIFESRISKITRSLEDLRGLCYTPPS
jgi:glutamate formiminotransferase / formiminotetrahydrofolate cyclodeaminase